MRRLIPHPRARFQLLTIMVVLCLCLSACVRSNTTIQVHPADLVSFDVEFRMNRQFAKQSGTNAQSITEHAKERLPAAAQAIATFTPIEEEAWVGTHASTVPLPAAQVHEFVRYTRNGATARVELPLNQYSMLDELGSVADLRQAGVEANVSVVFPGKVLATNGVITGNTVTWDLLQMNDDPWAEAQVGMEWWLIALIATAIIFGVILLVWGMAKLSRRPRRRHPRYQAYQS